MLAPTLLLSAALVLPVVLFWLLRSRVPQLSTSVAAAIAIATGWALSFAWAWAAHESTAVAARFGWACPAILVFLTWLTLRFASRRADPSPRIR